MQIVSCVKRRESKQGIEEQYAETKNQPSRYSENCFCDDYALVLVSPLITQNRADDDQDKRKKTGNPKDPVKDSNELVDCNHSFTFLQFIVRESDLD